jgi:hypothetical protein
LRRSQSRAITDRAFRRAAVVNSFVSYVPVAFAICAPLRKSAATSLAFFYSCSSRSFVAKQAARRKFAALQTVILNERRFYRE